MRRLFPLLLLLLAATAASGQGIDLDVKTHWSEKNELIAPKYGVIASIEKLGRWNVVEFGEDYSLWLTDLHRSTRGDSTVVEMRVELRTPALVQNGDLLESRTVRVAYASRTLDSLTSLPEITAYIARYTNEVAERDKLWKGACAVVVGKLGGPMLATLVVGVATTLVDELRHAPTPSELCESTLLGVHTVAAIETMLRNRTPQ